MRVEARADHFCAADGVDAGLDTRGDSLGERLGVGDENRRRELVVFGAGEQVGDHELGIGVGIGDDDRLGRTEDAVDADLAVELLLGDRDEDATGPADLVDLRDAVRAVGHRRDALHTARAEDAVDAGDVRGDELQRRDGAVFGLTGVTMTSSSTPATRAGTAVISSVDG